MVLRLNYLKLTNFKVHQDSHFTFSEGHNVILGENGAGKSSIFDAISFSLFGTVAGKPNYSLVRHGQKRMEVQLNITVDGEQYMIIRGLKGKTAYASLQLVSEDGVIAEKASTVTEEIETLLNFNHKTFNNVVYIPQGEIASIASESPSERRKLFDRILGYDNYQVLHDRLRFVEKTTEKTISNLQDRIGDFRGEVGKKGTYEEELTMLERELAEIREKLSTLEPELREEEASFQKLQEKKQVLSQLEERLHTLGEELAKDEKHSETLVIELEELSDGSYSFQEGDLPDTLDLVSKKLESARIDRETEEESVSKGKEIEYMIKQNEQGLKILRNHLKSLEKKIRSLKRILVDDWGPELISAMELEQRSQHTLQLLERNESDLEKEIEKEKERGILQDRRVTLLTQKSGLEKQERTLNKKIEARTPKSWKSVEVFLAEDLLAQLKSVDDQINFFQSQLRDIHSRKKSLEDQLLREKQLLKLLKADEGQSCPMCDQELTDEHLEQIQKDKERLTNELESEIEKCGERILELEVSLEQVKKNRKELEKLVKTQTELVNLTQNRMNIQNELKNCIERLQTVEEQFEQIGEDTKKVTTLKSEIKRLRSELEKITSTMAILKEIAEKEIDQADKVGELEELETHLAELRASPLLQNLAQHMEQLKQIKKLESTLYSIIPKVELLHSELKRIKSAKQEFQLLERKVDDQRVNFKEAEYGRVEAKVKDLNNQIVRLGTLAEEYEKKRIPEKQKQIQDIKKKEQTLEELVEKQKVESKKLESIKLLREFSKGVVPELRRQHVKHISDYSSEIFSYLLNNDEYEGIEVSEDYNLQVVQSGTKYSLTILSGGEQVISCLAIRLAVAKMLADQDILLLDEPTVMLDTNRRKELVEVFETTQPVGQTLIVTHDTEFERVADQTFNITKSAGRSRVKVDEMDEIMAEQKRMEESTSERFSRLEI